MRRAVKSVNARVARIVRQCLRTGAHVKIDGLGTFSPKPRGGFQFAALNKPRVFIGYVEEDLEFAKRIYYALASRGFDPWLDKKKLMPGQNWPRSIETAIQSSDFFIACFSKRAAAKRGGFQSELRYALECAKRVPLDDIFLIPVRLEECSVPPAITHRIQYVNLFPNWDGGFERLLASLRRNSSR